MDTDKVSVLLKKAAKILTILVLCISIQGLVLPSRVSAFIITSKNYDCLAPQININMSFIKNTLNPVSQLSDQEKTLIILKAELNNYMKNLNTEVFSYNSMYFEGLDRKILALLMNNILLNNGALVQAFEIAKTPESFLGVVKESEILLDTWSQFVEVLHKHGLLGEIGYADLIMEISRKRQGLKVFNAGIKKKVSELIVSNVKLSGGLFRIEPDMQILKASLGRIYLSEEPMLVEYREKIKIEAATFANSYNFETGNCDLKAKKVNERGLPPKSFGLRVIVGGKSNTSSIILSSI